MVDVIEASRDVRIQHVGCLAAQRDMDRFDGVVALPTRPEAITVRLEASLPFRLEGQLQQGLRGPIPHHRNPERSPLGPSRLGDPHPTGGPGLLVQAQGSSEMAPL